MHLAVKVLYRCFCLYCAASVRKVTGVAVQWTLTLYNGEIYPRSAYRAPWASPLPNASAVVVLIRYPLEWQLCDSFVHLLVHFMWWEWGGINQVWMSPVRVTWKRRADSRGSAPVVHVISLVTVATCLPHSSQSMRNSSGTICSNEQASCRLPQLSLFSALISHCSTSHGNFCIPRTDICWYLSLLHTTTFPKIWEQGNSLDFLSTYTRHISFKMYLFFLMTITIFFWGCPPQSLHHRHHLL